MDWLNKMNNAMDYVESNLANKISYDRTAQIACCSVYHFQRMFSFITGVPLSEYIRRRRLTLAAFELQTNKKVIDVAAKYGYESPEAFSRAFKNLHGVRPISARDNGVTLRAYPKITFSISIRGDIEMNYRIEENKTFEFFGLVMDTTVFDGQWYKDIPAFWDNCRKDGRYAALMQAAGKPIDGWADAGVTFGYDSDDSDGNMSYMIACRKPAIGCPPDYYELITLCQTWIVFSCDFDRQNDNFRETWRRIYTEWFPTADYEHADLDMDIEMYFGTEQTGYGVEIWIPVKRTGR